MQTSKASPSTPHSNAATGYKAAQRRAPSVLSPHPLDDSEAEATATAKATPPFSDYSFEAEATATAKATPPFSDYSFMVNVIHRGVLVSSCLACAPEADGIDACAWNEGDAAPDWWPAQDLQIEVRFAPARFAYCRPRSSILTVTYSHSQVSVSRACDGAVCPLYTASVDDDICALANDSDAYFRLFWPSAITAEGDEDYELSFGMMAALRSNGAITLSWIKCHDEEDDSLADDDERATYAKPTQAELDEYFATVLTWDGNCAMDDAPFEQDNHLQQKDAQIRQTAWATILADHVQACPFAPFGS